MKKLSRVLLLILLLATSSVVPRAQAQAASGGYGTVNLAKGKPVTAVTNTVRGSPSDVNDGNIDTVWYSFQGSPTNNSFVLDLGAVYTIGRIDIILAQVWSFTVSTSTDGANYTQRHTPPWSSASVTAPISLAVDGSYSARYIKYAGSANWSQYVGVQEIEVYEWLATPPSPQPGTYGAVNLALSRPATLQSGYSLVAGNPPSNATDGNPATTYAGSLPSRADDALKKYTSYGNISIDLGQSYKIGKIVVRPSAVHFYRIVMSNVSPYPAGSPWVFKDYAAQYGTASTIAEEFTFLVNGAQSARYLNIIIGVQATPSLMAPQLGEIEVYEWVAGASPGPADTSAPLTTTALSVAPTAGPVAYWSFNEGSGAVARDSSGNGNDGAISGATWTAGKFGNALNFDGNADFVKLPHTAINGLGDITFAVWIKTNANKDMGIITGANSATDNEFLLFIEAGSLSTTVKKQTFVARKKINDGQWHFIAVTRTGNTGDVLVYVDGQQDAKNTLTAGKLVIDPNGLWLGRDQDCVGGCWDTEQDFQGSMDEIVVYNRVLSQTEIQAAMVSGAAGQHLSAPAPSTTPGTTSDKASFRSNSYTVVLTKMPWKQAKSYAESLGGHLVTISDEPENTFVTDLARSKGVEKDFWIGLTDEAREGAFVWVTGEPLNYAKWHPGEPNNLGGNENYVLIGFQEKYTWNDYPGNEGRPFVVEFEGAVTATPTPAPAVKVTDSSLTAEERTTSPNSTITVPIRLDKADRLGSLNFSLRYDTSVLKVNRAVSGDLAGGTLFQANIRDAGIIRFGIVAQGTAGITGDGPVAHVEFTALGARGAQSQLTLGDLMATDTSGARLGVTLRNGRVSIAAKLKGDYDGDGKVTAKDSLAALKMSVGELAEDLNLDMDGDGKVTAEDARRILAGALGGPVATPAPPSQPTPPTQPTTATAPGGGPGTAPTAVRVVDTIARDIDSKGGSLSLKNGITVVVPSETVDAATKLTINKLDTENPGPGISRHEFKGFEFLATYQVTLGDMSEFKTPLTIEIAYDPTKIASDYPPEKIMLAAWWDPDQKTWRNTPVQVDTQRKVVVIRTRHLTIWTAIWLVRGYKIRETDHFIVVYDPKVIPQFDVETDIPARRGRGERTKLVGTAQEPADFAQRVGVNVEQAYKKYMDKGFRDPRWTVGHTIEAVSVPTTVIPGTSIPVFAPPELKIFVIVEKVDESFTATWFGNIHLATNYADADEVKLETGHELFHAVQQTYYWWRGIGSGYGRGQWFMEASANYASDRIAWDGLNTMNKVRKNYFSLPLATVDGKNHEYETAHFIDYLVTKGANFKAMWDAVASSYSGLATARPLEQYSLQATKTTLHDHYRGFAAQVLFNASGPLEKLDGNLFDSGIPEGPPLMTADDDELSHRFSLRGDYTAKLWGFKAAPRNPTSPRALRIEATGAVPAAADVDANVYVLKNDQRPQGGVDSNPGLYKGTINSNKKSLSLSVAQDEVVYILAVNTGASDQTFTVKVSEDVGGDWVLTGRVVERVPKTDVSEDVPGRDITLDRSVTTGGNGATVAIGWRAKGASPASTYKAQWTCTWMGPPPPTPPTGQWSGPGVASKQPGNFAEVIIDTSTYKSRWLCNTPATAPPVSGWTEGETWDTTVTVVNPRTGTNRNVTVEPRKSVDKSRWSCNWPEPPTSIKPGQEWGGTVGISDAGSDTPTAAWVGGRVSLKLGSGQIVLLDVKLPSQASASQKFSWQAPTTEMTIVAFCSATMQPYDAGQFAAGTDPIGDTSVTITYKYELRK